VKTETMWVATTTGAKEAAVHWQGDGLAVTQLPEQSPAITHVNTGQAIIASTTNGMKTEMVVRIAQTVAPLLPWESIGYSEAILRRAEMASRISAALKASGVLQ
jgi:hypothetical protein